MRGSLLHPFRLSDNVGIIPAHAGLTFLRFAPLVSRGDHPRACGAHSNMENMSLYEQGSSPRMRGSPQTASDEKIVDGIIPAHAGLTPASSSARTASWDHPRACGAHRPACSAPPGLSGSSPRMRGSPSLFIGALDEEGIIPAHAGLTSRMSRLTRCSRDHPRACGAHHRSTLQIFAPLGSSPRMRGSHFVIKKGIKKYGIIPAHAGLT